MKKNHHISEGSPFVTFIFYFLTAVCCFITLYPMYYVFIMSISNPKSVMAMDVFFYPKGIYLDSYEMLLKNTAMWRSYLNTIIYTATSTVLVVITSVLGAYPLTLPRLKGKKFLVMYLLLPMYFSGGMIPTFLLMSKIGLYDNMWAIIIPSAVNIWYIILVRTFFVGMPNEIRESAYMDGATNMQVLYHIYVPIATPVLAVISIYAIVGMWNSWFSAQIYLPSEELHPLQMYLNRVLVQQTVDMREIKNLMDKQNAIKKMMSAIQIKYAMIIFTTLPVMFTYPFFQKYFVKGVMLGSLKG